MPALLNDQFANYVVQRALHVSQAQQGLELAKAILPHLSAMRNSTSCRRIASRILKRFPNLASDPALLNYNFHS
jgi:hypothetical protein